MALNFPKDPTLNEEYVVDGVVYIYDGEKWTSRGSTSGLPLVPDADGNVSITGDLDVAGSAEFAGTVQVGDDNPDRIKLFANGLISVRRDDGDILNVYKGGLNADNRTVEINSTGSATFEGKVDVNNELHVYRASTTASNALLALHSDIGGADTRKATVRADGSAEFDGGVRGGNGTIPQSAAWTLAAANNWTTSATSINFPTLASSNADLGRTGVIRLTGSTAPTWSGNFKFPGGSAPSITSFPAIIPYYCDGTNMMMGAVTEGIS